MQPYTSVEQFIEWMPNRYLSELTDDVGGFEIDNTKIVKAMDWAAGFLESHVNLRSDIPIPVVNNDGSINPEVMEAIHDLTLFRLFIRRGHVPDDVQMQFTMQRDWLRDISMRRANIHITGRANRVVTKVNDQPIIDGREENKFEDFTFG